MLCGEGRFLSSAKLTLHYRREFDYHDEVEAHTYKSWPNQHLRVAREKTRSERNLAWQFTQPALQRPLSSTRAEVDPRISNHQRNLHEALFVRVASCMKPARQGATLGASLGNVLSKHLDPSLFRHLSPKLSPSGSLKKFRF